MQDHIAPFLACIMACATVCSVSLPANLAHAAGIWYVSPVGNDASACNVPEAPCSTINGALGKADDGDVIRVSVGRYTGTGDEVVLLTKSISLSGGWDAAFVKQTGYSTIDGQNSRRGVSIPNAVSGPIVYIDRFIVQNGNSKQGFGGGINFTAADGDLFLTNSIIRNNRSGDPCCIGGGGGGGIFSSGRRLVITNSALVSNRVIGFTGGAIYGTSSTLTTPPIILVNSTVSGNLGWESLHNFSADFQLYNTTVADNQGGISVIAGKLLLSNSIVARNKINNCKLKTGYFNTFNNQGYNILAPANSPDDCVPGATDIASDPQVNTFLADNVDGSVMAPALGSPAINAGNPAGCKDHLGNPITVDQRGITRIGRCDIGAAEAILGMQKRANREILLPGDELEYTIRLQNVVGSDDTSATFITDTLPAQLSYVTGSLTATSGIAGISNHVLTWSGKVDGAETKVVYRARVNSDVPMNTTITNAVMASWSGYAEAAQAPILVSSRAYVPINVREACLVDDFLETFDDPFSGWPIIFDPVANINYDNGEYKIALKRENLIATISAPACTPSSYVLDVDARWASDLGNSYGLIFNRSKPWWYGPDYFLFEVNTEFMMFRVLQHTPNGFEMVIPPTETDAILPGRSTNRLTIIGTGGKATLVINGKAVAEGMFFGVNMHYRAGLLASTYPDGPNAEARFDNFRIRALPPTAMTMTRAQTLQPGKHVDWPLPDPTSVMDVQR